jgi:CRP/FNR family putative post-exponential-phase nitrogen-starvation transcriptional regulator
MKTITDPHVLRDYTTRFPIDALFGFDIRPYLELVRFSSEELLMQEGACVDRLLYLLEGRTKLFITNPNGRVLLLDFLNAPCFIGEMELIGAQEFSDGVAAVTSCTCYLIHVDKCRAKLLNDAQFLRSVCLLVSKRSIEECLAFSRSLSYPLKNRLAGFILMAAHHSVYSEKHTETAEYLGVTYRHLLYVLAEFVDEGILKRTKQGYQITDMEALKKLSRFS